MKYAIQEQEHWFNKNLKPHETILRKWLNYRYNIASEIDDIIQDSYRKVLSARNLNVIQSPKAYLFATARNLVLMRLRHMKVENICYLEENAFSSILDTSEVVTESVLRNERLEILKDAINSLPKKCKQIVILRKLNGMSQKAISFKLGISESTVEAQAVIAIKKMAIYFRAHDEK